MPCCDQHAQSTYAHNTHLPSQTRSYRYLRAMAPKQKKALPEPEKFETGDIVLCKVKGYPEWPGKVRSRYCELEWKLMLALHCAILCRVALLLWSRRLAFRTAFIDNLRLHTPLYGQPLHAVHAVLLLAAVTTMRTMRYRSSTRPLRLKM